MAGVKDDIKQLRTEVQTLVNQGTALHLDLEAKGDKATGEDRTKLENLIADGKKKREKLDLLLELDAQDDLVNTPAGKRQAKESPGERAARRLTWGEKVVSSEQFKKNNGKQMEFVQVREPSAGKAIYNDTDSQGGAAVRQDRLPEILEIARRRPRTLIDLVNTAETSVDAIEWVRFVSRTNNAAVVPERASGNFGLKPEGDLELDLVTTPVKTIAEWIPASRQILADAPRLRDLIDSELMYHLEFVLENQIVSGSGSGSNFTGILNTSGIQVRTMHATTPVGRAQTTSDTKLDTLRRALTDIRLAFYDADGIALAPGDSEAIELSKDANGNYMNIYDPVMMRVWRTQVVETQALSTGTALVGAWKLGATLWDRMQSEIRVGEPNDLFLRNAVAILAELRAAFAVTRPLAFEKVTLI